MTHASYILVLCLLLNACLPNTSHSVKEPNMTKLQGKSTVENEQNLTLLNLPIETVEIPQTDIKVVVSSLSSKIIEFETQIDKGTLQLHEPVLQLKRNGDSYLILAVEVRRTLIPGGVYLQLFKEVKGVFEQLYYVKVAEYIRLVDLLQIEEKIQALVLDVDLMNANSGESEAGLYSYRIVGDKLVSTK